MNEKQLTRRGLWGTPALFTRGGDPFFGLQRDLNQVFNSFFKDTDWPAATLPEWKSEFVPRMDVTEDDKYVRVEMELAGLSDKDVKLTIENDTLTISGEKKSETDSKDKHYHRVERSYGAFQRSLSLPPTIDENRVEATFKNGVLRIDLPKSAEAQKQVKTIPVQNA